MGRKELIDMSMSYSSTYTAPRRTNTVNDSVARNRISQLERQLRDSQNAAQRIRNDSNRRIDAIRAQMERENREFRRRETEIGREVNQIRRQSNRALNEMAVRHANDLTQVQNRISETSRRIYADMNTMQDRLTGQMNEEIGTLRSEVSVRFDAIEDAMRTIQNDNQAMIAGAAEYVETARDVIDNAVNNHRAEQLLPDRQIRVNQALANAIHQIEYTREHPGNAAVARASAREAMQEAIYFEQEVLAAEYAWEVARTQTLTALANAEEEITASEHVVLEDEDNYEVDTDLYTGGAIAALRGETDNLRNRVEDDNSRLTMDDLSGIAQRAASIGEDVNTAARYAVEACLRSQERADISQDIFEELRDRFGMTVSEFAYQGREYPAGTRLHLKNPVTGFEMMVSCTPVETDGHVVNEITSDVLNYGNFTNNSEEGDRIARQALEIIGSGTGISGPITTASCEERRRPASLLAGDMRTFEREAAEYPGYNAGSRSETQRTGMTG
jgi:hypothetical protein